MRVMVASVSHCSSWEANANVAGGDEWACDPRADQPCRAPQKEGHGRNQRANENCSTVLHYTVDVKKERARDGARV